MLKTTKEKITITLLIMFFIQILSNIPSLGINKELISAFLNTQTGSLLNNFAFLSGNALSNMTLTVIGISPFITVSIIIQLLRIAFPVLDERFSDGKIGEKLYKKSSTIAGIVLSILQSIPTAILLGKHGVLVENNFKYIFLCSISFMTGSIILILLSMLIDKKGIGNGISLILLCNIVSRLPSDMSVILNMYGKNKIIFMILASIITFLIVNLFLIWSIYLQCGESRIQTVHASNKASAVKNFIPIKVNIAGVMPIIFMMNIFQVINMIIAFFNISEDSILYKFSKLITPSYWFDKENLIYTLGIIIYIAGLYFFQTFYTEISFDTFKISNDLKKRGGTIPGIRPGKPTQEYIEKAVNNIKLFGFIGITVIAIVPTLLTSLFRVNSFSFTGTSIIIVVGVIIEFSKQLESESYFKTSKRIF